MFLVFKLLIKIPVADPGSSTSAFCLSLFLSQPAAPLHDGPPSWGSLNIYIQDEKAWALQL